MCRLCCVQALEKSVEAGGALDSYEIEGPDRAELLQDLAEFQLAAVSLLLVQYLLVQHLLACWLHFSCLSTAACGGNVSQVDRQLVHSVTDNSLFLPCTLCLSEA